MDISFYMKKLGCPYYAGFFITTVFKGYTIFPHLTNVIEVN